MAQVTLTRELAFASGQDAANRAMTKAGRAKWNEEDADLATRTTNKFLLYVPFEHGGLNGIPLTPSMLSDLGVTAADAQKAGCEVVGHNGGPVLEAA